jgi:hypothetical protein
MIILTHVSFNTSKTSKHTPSFKYSSCYLLISLFPLCINPLKYKPFPFIEPERAPPVGIVRNHHPSIPDHPIPSTPCSGEKTPNTIPITPNPSLYVCIYSILPSIAYRINTQARKNKTIYLLHPENPLFYSILFQPVFSVLAYPSKALIVKSTTSGTVDQGPNVSVTPQPSCIAFLL